MKIGWKSLVFGFVIGLAFGVFGTVRCGTHGMGGIFNNPAKFHERMMHEFTKKLNLTADQQTQVSSILDDTRTKINALRQDTRPRFEAVRESANAQIRKTLSAEQQTKFDVLSAEMKARFEKKRAQFSGF